MSRAPGWIFESSMPGPQAYDYHSGAVTPARTPLAQRSATGSMQFAFPTSILMPAPPNTPQFPVPQPHHPSPVGPSPQHQSYQIADVQHTHSDHPAWQGIAQSTSNPIDNQLLAPPLAPWHLPTSNESALLPPLAPPRPQLHIYTSTEFLPLPPHHYTSHPPESRRLYQRQNQGQDAGGGSNEPNTGTGITSGQRGYALKGIPGNGEQPGEARALRLTEEQGLRGDRAPRSSAGQSGGFTGLTIEQLMERRKPVDLGDRVVIYKPQTPIRGGYGEVYVGFFEGQRVAVKIIQARTIPEEEKIHEKQVNERRVRREMKVWAALKHPNICEFLGYTTSHSDCSAMVSPWCDGQTATQYLQKQTLSAKDRVILTHDVSKGLQYMHNLKVIHGDMKPMNVLVDKQGVAQLCDFGLARLPSWQGLAEMTTTTPYTGTTSYKAPELFASVENRFPVATFKGDIYSLGCIMLEFIERLCPFERLRTPPGGQAAIECKGPPAERSEAKDALGPDMTEPLWKLLETCWKESPTERPEIRHIVEKLDFFAQTTLT